jgi:serine/threonine-protein kinase/endoribonuclease IRE1
MLISDFGLCRRLEIDQTSFLPTAHGNLAAGTVGWRAPEILCGEVNVDSSSFADDNASQSSRGSSSTVNGGNGSGPSAPRPKRLTKSVDIFAIGCVFYYTLTNGSHPYGDRYERDTNIVKDKKSLDQLERFGEEGTEAVDLIDAMLNYEPSTRYVHRNNDWARRLSCYRPDTQAIMLHPYFWDSNRRLTFLTDVSDRFEVMCRDPRDAMLVRLETGAPTVVGHDWHQRLDRVFLDNLGKFRKYEGKSVQDLMRALRNKVGIAGSYLVGKNADRPSAEPLSRPP